MKKTIACLIVIFIVCFVTACDVQQTNKILTTTQTTEVIFPAHELGKNEYNAKIYDIKPFKLSIQLPVGWTIKIPQTADEVKGEFTSVNIYQEDTFKGNVSYNLFKIYEGTTEENFYRSVYNQLMLGSVVNWDNEYTPVKQDENNCSATCKISVQSPNNEEVTYLSGILAYNKELLVYVAISFEKDVISNKELVDIAKSITLVHSQ